MNKTRLFLTAVTTSTLITAMAPADVVTLTPEKDNTIYDESDDISNGAGRYLFAGRTDGSRLRRALVKFDIAGSSIPPGSEITSVVLQLEMTRTQASNQSVALHRLLTDWGEGASDSPGQEGAGDSAEDGDATWVYTFYNTSDPPSAPQWASEGGDYVGTASATTVVGSEATYFWGSNSTMVSDVEGWLGSPASNFGWILIGNENQDKTAKRFNSRDINDPPTRPQLTINFNPPAVDGACCFPDGSCQQLNVSTCLNQGGAFQGTGSVCGAVTCPIIQGACCFNDSSCLVLTETDCSNQGGIYQGDDTSCTADLCPLVLTPYLDALPIPGVLQPISGVPGGVATYDVDMTEFQQQLHSELAPTTVWGYAGSYPGPTIEATSGNSVTVNWINSLPATHHLPVDTCMHGADDNSTRTVVHLHGAHVPAAFDGYPEDTFLPGNQATYFYPNNQLPATLWFHDHALGITRLNVYMGLAAFYLIRDDFEKNLPLPEGEFEVPMVIQDRAFNADGSLKYPNPWQDAFFGDKILVNGKVWPFLDVKQARYRFRIINGSNSRTYLLTLSEPLPFHLIGTDGGLLPQTLTVNQLLLAPAERADIIIDFSTLAPGTEVFLTNSAPAPFPGDPGVGVVPQVMKFNVLDETGDTPPIPSQLRPFDELEEEDSVRTREFELQKVQGGCAGFEWRINGLLWDDITEFPRLGHTEIWSFINRSGIIHPMHMHLVMFQVLDRQDYEVVADEIVPIGDPMIPDPTEEGWKDTVRANPQQITRVIARFESYEGLYPYHCHILEHEDHEMMRQFETLPPCPWDCARPIDDVVDVVDFFELIAQWSMVGSTCDFDLGLPGVDTADFFELLAQWGACPQ